MSFRLFSVMLVLFKAKILLLFPLDGLPSLASRKRPSRRKEEERGERGKEASALQIYMSCLPLYGGQASLETGCCKGERLQRVAEKGEGSNRLLSRDGVALLAVQPGNLWIFAKKGETMVRIFPFPSRPFLAWREKKQR